MADNETPTAAAAATPTADAASVEYPQPTIDPQALQTVLDGLAEEPEQAPPVTEQPKSDGPKSDEVLEPLSNIGNCP